MLKKIIALLLASVVFILAGCNTVSGMGQDVKAAGGAIENTADRAKKY